MDLARLDRQPLGTPHHPSVDVLFQSAAEGWGRDAVALVLTGMGEDGLQGARAVRAAGGVVLTEAESSCVVYGMPRAVAEAGLSHGSAPLDELVPLLGRYILEAAPSWAGFRAGARGAGEAARAAAPSWAARGAAA